MSGYIEDYDSDFEDYLDDSDIDSESESDSDGYNYAVPFQLQSIMGLPSNLYQPQQQPSYSQTQQPSFSPQPQIPSYSQTQQPPMPSFSPMQQPQQQPQIPSFSPMQQPQIPSFSPMQQPQQQPQIPSFSPMQQPQQQPQIPSFSPMQQPQIPSFSPMQQPQIPSFSPMQQPTMTQPPPQIPSFSPMQQPTMTQQQPQIPSFSQMQQPSFVPMQQQQVPFFGDITSVLERKVIDPPEIKNDVNKENFPILSKLRTTSIQKVHPNAMFQQRKGIISPSQTEGPRIEQTYNVRPIDQIPVKPLPSLPELKKPEFITTPSPTLMTSSYQQITLPIQTTVKQPVIGSYSTAQPQMPQQQMYQQTQMDRQKFDLLKNINPNLIVSKKPKKSVPGMNYYDVKQLKAFLKALGENTKGNKPELVERLRSVYYRYMGQ